MALNYPITTAFVKIIIFLYGKDSYSDLMYMERMTRKYADNNIRKLRKDRGMSMEELGSRMPSDLTMSTISKLEKRAMGLLSTISGEIAEVLNVPASAIISNSAQDVRLVPLIGYISAGNWQDALQESGSYIPSPDHLKAKNLFALRPMGDSMNLIVPDGGYVIVDPDQTELKNGKCYAVMNGDQETTCKRYNANPPLLEPVSDNPEHKAITLGKEPFIVIGRLVHVSADL